MRRRDLLPDSVLENLGSLLDAIREARSDGDDPAASPSVHFLRNYTTEPIDPYLQFHLLRDGIDPAIQHGGYDTMVQEVLDPDSDLHQSQPDVIVLSLLIEFLDPGCSSSSWSADDAIAQIDKLVGHVLQRATALLVINTLLPPIDSLLADDAGCSDELRRLNEHVAERAVANAGRVFVCDFADLYERAGGAEALDRRFWAASQAPFRKPFLVEYAADIAYYIRVLTGKARKCLVLDCDNTIWGGVIGEDGLDGIVLHDDTPPGCYFREFQQAAIGLHDQGVMLALCSKNNEDDVWEVLDRHPHCALQKSHLVAWRINWENKAANIAGLAAELNIGLDSLVFVDDSPQERALIEDALPEVLVLPVPDTLEHYAETLTKEKLFDTTAQSDEDRRRTRMYQDETNRKQQQQSFEDLTEYLKSLQTRMRVSAVNDDNRTRITQLTQKTNQFNLTTRRYSEADIERFAGDDDAAVLAMSVEDRYGDMGLTGVFIARRDGETAAVDTLLLSCRVLGRQLEFAFVDQCLRLLQKRWGKLAWRADFVPTRKNAQVADFWDRAGFELHATTDGNRHYVADDPAVPADYSDTIAVELE